MKNLIMLLKTYFWKLTLEFSYILINKAEINVESFCQPK